MMKTFLRVTILLSLLLALQLLIPLKVLSQVFQADEWCNNFPNMPGSGAIWGHASCVLGDTIYVAGGSSSGTTTNVFYKYSISGNSWLAINNLPGLKAGGDLVACRNKIYYIGGGNTIINNGDSAQYVYNPATGGWSTIANIPIPVTGNVAESYRDSLIYCMMGGWNTYETVIQVYNVVTNTWAQATPMPSGNGRRSFAGGILGNKLFVCAGFSSAFRNDFWVGTINPANPLVITWQQRTNLAIATSRPGGTAIYGKFYVVMGEINGGIANDSLAVWDTTTAAWTYKDGKPNRTNNLYGSVASSVTYCGTRPGVKIWSVGGSYGTQSNRPLDVYADTCLLNCTGVLTGINNNQIPVKYSLLQNYPNPFNPATKITYQIPASGEVTLTVTDILGRETAVLVNEFKQAGVFEQSFQGGNYSSGVYFYKLEVKNIQTGIIEFSDTKKMVLLK